MRNIKLYLILLFSLCISSGKAFSLATITDYYTDDFDKLSEHGIVRILVVYDAVNYYFIDGHEDGLAVSLSKNFKKFVNENYSKSNKIDIQFIPVREDQIYKLLLKGVGDIAASFIIPTERRASEIAYTDPFLTDLKEFIVTGLNVKPITQIQELSGLTVYIRKSSKSYESIKTINDILTNLKLPKINIVLVEESMQDGELIKRVQQKEIPATIVNSGKIKLWKRLFNNVRYHETLPLNSRLTMNWAVRPYNYHLLNIINKFINSYNQNTEKGKKIFATYLLGDPTSSKKFSQKENYHTLGLKLEDFEKFNKIFKKYGDEFDIDWHLLMCQAYKESSFNQNAKSERGAVGILQVSPSLANNFLVKSTEELNNMDGNIRAATMYMRYILDNYVNKNFYVDNNNKMAFALAGYNAGPGRIKQYQKLAEKQGLDPNIWFGNVENVVKSKGLNETVNYVSSIMKCHKAYIQSEKTQNRKKQK